jgi:hypothetical protein
MIGIFPHDGINKSFMIGIFPHDGINKSSFQS